MGCKYFHELGDIPARELNLRLVNRAMQQDISWDQEKIRAYQAQQARAEMEAFKQRARAHFDAKQSNQQRDD
ncbi:MAG: hypothetical protein KTR20_12855 [Cellvibrionaceae bacterium]|nr:hypothetical protein [Cellvibrionaceae bacterium]